MKPTVDTSELREGDEVEAESVTVVRRRRKQDWGAAGGDNSKS